MATAIEAYRREKSRAKAVTGELAKAEGKCRRLVELADDILCDLETIQSEFIRFKSHGNLTTSGLDFVDRVIARGRARLTKLESEG